MVAFDERTSKLTGSTLYLTQPADPCDWAVFTSYHPSSSSSSSSPKIIPTSSPISSLSSYYYYVGVCLFEYSYTLPHKTAPFSPSSFSSSISLFFVPSIIQTSFLILHLFPLQKKRGNLTLPLFFFSNIVSEFYSSFILVWLRIFKLPRFGFCLISHQRL